MSAFNITDIIKRFEAAQLAANKANEDRYQQILSSLSGQGAAARRRVDQQATQAGGAADQDLISRGLGNTTIRQSVQRGVASDKELANQSIDEQVAGMRAGVMERRNDEGPDLSMYANLIQAASAAGDPNRRTQAFIGRGVPAGGIGGGGGGGGSSGGGSFGGGRGGLIRFGEGGGGGGGGTDASIVRGTGSVTPPVPTAAAPVAAPARAPRATGGSGTVSATNGSWSYMVKDGITYRGPSDGSGSWTPMGAGAAIPARARGEYEDIFPGMRINGHPY